MVEQNFDIRYYEQLFMVELIFLKCIFLQCGRRKHTPGRGMKIFCQIDRVINARVVNCTKMCGKIQNKTIFVAYLPNLVARVFHE